MRISANSSADPRERRVGRWRWLAAILLAVAIHALSLGFRPLALPPQVTDAIGTRSIRMFPLDQPVPAQDSLRHWYNWNNPLHFAKPTALAYSVVPRRAKVLDLPMLAACSPAVLRPNGFTPLVADPTPVAARIATHWPGTILMPPPAPASTLPPDAYPHWIAQGSHALPQVFLDPATIREQSAAAAVSRPTGLMVRGKGHRFLPRIQVVESCGKVELDQAAVQALLQAAERMIGEFDGGRWPEPCYIAVFWRPSAPSAQEFPAP